MIIFIKEEAMRMTWEHLKRLMKLNWVTKKKLAKVSAMTQKYVHWVMQWRELITEDFAKHLENIFDVSKEFWLKSQEASKKSFWSGIFEKIFCKDKGGIYRIVECEEYQKKTVYVIQQRIWEYYYDLNIDWETRVWPQWYRFWWERKEYKTIPLAKRRKEYFEKYFYKETPIWE